MMWAASTSAVACTPSPCTRTLPVIPGRRTTTSPNVDRDISTPRDVAAGEHSRPQAVAGVAVVLVSRPGVPLLWRRLGPAAGGGPLFPPGLEEGLSDVLPRGLPLSEQSFVEADGELPGVSVW